MEESKILKLHVPVFYNCGFPLDKLYNVNRERRNYDKSTCCTSDVLQFTEKIWKIRQDQKMSHYNADSFTRNWNWEEISEQDVDIDFKHYEDGIFTSSDGFPYNILGFKEHPRIENLKQNYDYSYTRTNITSYTIYVRVYAHSKTNKCIEIPKTEKTPIEGRFSFYLMCKDIYAMRADCEKWAKDEYETEIYPHDYDMWIEAANRCGATLRDTGKKMYPSMKHPTYTLPIMAFSFIKE